MSYLLHPSPCRLQLCPLSTPWDSEQGWHTILLPRPSPRGHDNHEVMVLPPSLFVQASMLQTLTTVSVLDNSPPQRTFDVGLPPFPSPNLGNSTGMVTAWSLWTISHLRGGWFYYTMILQWLVTQASPNHPTYQQWLLVARHEKYYHQLHQGLCPLSIQKEQSHKPQTTPFTITCNTHTLPFISIALDFIVKLSQLNHYDTILIIMDTFSKASIFITCNETINSEQTASLYTTYVLPHFGLPSWVISNQDPHFTSTFTLELCKLLQVEQNTSMAYYPQTDGQSECTNQWLEQYLCLFGNFDQDDRACWLPLAQYVHNSWPNTTMKKAPFVLIMEHLPRTHQPTHTSKSPSVNDLLQQIKESQQQARDAIKQAQELMTRLPSNFVPYNVRYKVWLEAQNLNTSHPSTKLAPKCYGSFNIKEVILHTSFWLQLPPSSKIQPVFHALIVTPYKETKEHRTNFPEPPPDLINE